MENGSTFVLSGLRAKRAEIDGELRAAEKHAAQLRADLDTIDRAILVFDPTAHPHLIRPRKPRAHKTGLRRGDLSRAAMNVIRSATVPLTAKEIAVRVAEDRKLAFDTASAREALVNRVRNALVRHPDSVIREKDGERVVWRLAGPE